MAATLEGINSQLLWRFMALQRDAAAAGHQIGVTSGVRSTAEQARLRKRNGCPNTWTAPASACKIPTAIPGQSKHNHGLAIDISGSPAAKAWVGANAARYGLVLPVAGEDWHLEMAEDGVSGPIMASMPDSIGFDMTWVDRAQSPEEVMDAQVRMVLGVMAGAARDELATPQAAELAAPAPPQLAGQSRVTTQPAPQSNVWRPPTTTAPPGGGIPPPGYVPSGEGVERWRPVALAALAYTGQDPKWVDLMLQRMDQESGGDPMAVNDWDANARRGDPSRGLMQNIGSAFAERARELTDRGIYDGFANMVASIRYTLGRYGTLAAWGRAGGY